MCVSPSTCLSVCMPKYLRLSARNHFLDYYNPRDAFHPCLVRWLNRIIDPDAIPAEWKRRRSCILRHIACRH